MKSVTIPKKVWRSWGQSPQAKYDALCVKRGTLLAQGVPQAEVDRRLPLPRARS